MCLPFNLQQCIGNESSGRLLKYLEFGSKTGRAVQQQPSYSEGTYHRRASTYLRITLRKSLPSKHVRDTYYTWPMSPLPTACRPFRPLHVMVAIKWPNDTRCCFYWISVTSCQKARLYYRFQKANKIEHPLIPYNNQLTYKYVLSASASTKFISLPSSNSSCRECLESWEEWGDGETCAPDRLLSSGALVGRCTQLKLYPTNTEPSCWGSHHANGRIFWRKSEHVDGSVEGVRGGGGR